MKKIVYLALMLTISASTFAQSNNIPQPELDSGTIEGQFDYIIEKSTKFRDFQLIRKPSILKIKANTLDSIKTIRKDLIVANTSIEQNKSTISQLETEVEGLKNEVTSISKDVDSISFMGVDLSKVNYNMIVWSLIIVLLLGLIVFISMFKKGNLDSTKTLSNLEKLEKIYRGEHMSINTISLPSCYFKLCISRYPDIF